MYFYKDFTIITKLRKFFKDTNSSLSHTIYNNDENSAKYKQAFGIIKKIYNIYYHTLKKDYDRLDLTSSQRRRILSISGFEYLL